MQLDLSLLSDMFHVKHCSPMLDEMVQHANISPDLNMLSSVTSAVLVFVTLHSGRYMHSNFCLLYTSPSPRDQLSSRMPSSA